MNKKHLAIIALTVFCLTATLSLIPFSESAIPYDPWADVSGPTQGTEDGTINMRDISYLIQMFGTSGNTTKNVSVMNWPVTTQQTVFWTDTISTNSPLYNASGFGHIHMIWDVSGLVDPENVTIKIYSAIYDPEGGGWLAVYTQPLVVTSTNAEGSLSFPVPAEMFGFWMSLAPGTTASVNLAYYLTYA